MNQNEGPAAAMPTGPGEQMKRHATVPPKLSQPGDSVKRPPERPDDTLKRLASKSWRRAWA